MSRMNEISGKVRGWVHTALMIYSAKALPLEKGVAYCFFRGLFALQCVQQFAKLIHGRLQIFHDILC